MELDQLLARSAALEERIADFFALPLANSSPRLQSVQALTSLGFEHATSLKYLVAARLCTSAAALLRVQYESLVRALWVLYCASDAKAEQMIADLTYESAKQNSKIPMLSEMLEDIEQKAPHAPVDKLKAFKYSAWRPLNSFVHGGIHAVNRHGRGFPLELVHMQVRHSNGLMGIAGNLLLIITGVPPEAQVMTKLYDEFSECFPPINPPYSPHAEAAY